MILQQINRILLLLVFFSMPLFKKLNIILLFLFIVFSFIEIIYSKHYKTLFKNIKFTWSVIIFFFLAVIALLLDFSGSNIKIFEKYYSFLLIPVIFLSNPQFFKKEISNIFKALIIGVAMSLVICLSNTIYEMIVNNEPLSYFFRWRHMNSQFTEIIGIHPSYLGLFMSISIYYILFHKPFSKIWNTLLFLFLFFELFQIAARISIIVSIIFILIYVLKRLKSNKKLMLLIILMAAFVISFFYKNASEVMMDRLFSVEKIVKDKRFNRWEVSYEVFKEKPFLGYGLSRINDKRLSTYWENGDINAFLYKYNAHNQFLEYLVINGILGGIVYIVVFGFLVYSSLREYLYLFSVIFIAFFIANLTDSLMQRILGIEFYSLFASLYLTYYSTRKT